MEIINYKIKDIPSDDDINVLLASKQHPYEYLGSIKCKSIWDLPFSLVDEIKERTNDMLFLMEVFYGVKEKQLQEYRIVSFFRAFNYIKFQIESIYKAEQRLVKEPDEKLKAAGIDELSILGSFNVIDDVATAYGVRPKEVEQWSYSEIYLKTLKNSITNKIQENYARN